MKKKQVIWCIVAVFLILLLSDRSQTEISSSQNSAQALPVTLLAQLKNIDPKIRERAAEELGKSADAEAVTPLILALKYDDVYRVRKAAAWALGELKDKQAVLPLMQALSHSDWIIRSNAAEALGKIGDPFPVAALTDLLQEENYNVIEKVVWALGEIAQERSLIPLVENLQIEIPAIRSETAKALGKIGDRRALPNLIALLESERNPDVKKWIIWALGEIPDNAALQSLALALTDNDYNVRLQAQVSLEKAGTQAVPFLIAALQHEKGYVRNRALWALEEMSGERYGLDVPAWEKWMNGLQ